MYILQQSDSERTNQETQAKEAAMLQIQTIISAPFDENTYVVWQPPCTDCLVIDPGLQPELILDFLGQQSLKVAAILNTHGHADHIAGNGEMKAAFPDAPLMIGAGDEAMLADAGLNLSAPFGLPLTSPAADQLLREGDVVEAAGLRLEVLADPRLPQGGPGWGNNGNFLLNNCIGFQGTLQYKLHDEGQEKDPKTMLLGSGFHADPVDPLVQSSDPSFRPVDIEFAPDGSLYLADWYNPLVGHMQHSIRDPNRDHSHGRIWRVSYKNRPLVKPAKIDGQPIAALLDLLRTEPEERTHYRVRSELWNRPTGDVIGETAKWLAGLASDPMYEHHKLEALWLHQAHDTINEPLLKDVLRSSDFRARAAATRVLGYWRDRVEKPLELLRQQASDEHPRVRLEAVRALSFFGSQEAIDVAVESLVFDQDDYLKYTFNETMKTLERRVKGQTGLPHEGTDWDKRNAEGYREPPADKGAKDKGAKAKAK
jgi:hypothetical protein